jgi:hypothetical protein
MSKLNYNRPCFRKGKDVRIDEGNEPLQQKVYLIVTYADKDIVKSMGATWDTEHRLWYVYPKNPHIQKLKKWIHHTDYDRCGLDPKHELNELLKRLKKNK